MISFCRLSFSSWESLDVSVLIGDSLKIRCYQFAKILMTTTQKVKYHERSEFIGAIATSWLPGLEGRAYTLLRNVRYAKIFSQ